MALSQRDLKTRFALVFRHKDGGLILVEGSCQKQWEIRRGFCRRDLGLNARLAPALCMCRRQNFVREDEGLVGVRLDEKCRFLGCDLTVLEARPHRRILNMPSAAADLPDHLLSSPEACQEINGYLKVMDTTLTPPICFECFRQKRVPCHCMPGQEYSGLSYRSTRVLWVLED